MGQTRRTFSADQKAEVVRRHLRDKVPVSDLADQKVSGSAGSMWSTIFSASARLKLPIRQPLFESALKPQTPRTSSYQ